MPTWTLSVSPAAGAGLPAVDVVVEAQPQATVADLARALGRHLAPERSGLLVAPTSAGRPWAAGARLSECALRTGDLVDVVTVPAGWLERPAPSREARAVIRVLDGPDAGRTVAVTTPSAVVGRGPDATVRLTDPLVSSRHARLDLSGEPTVVDEGSANGTLLDGHRVERATRLLPGVPVVVGGTTFVLDRAARTTSDPVSVHRSPLFGPPLEVEDLEVPSPPNRPRPTPFMWAMAALPVVIGAGLFLQTRSPFALTYVVAWPLVMVGGWWQQRRSARREHEKDLAAWRRRLARITARLDEQAAEQHRRALTDHPDPSALLRRAGNRDGTLWARQEHGPDFLAVRVGLGDVPALLTASLREGGDDEVVEPVQADLERRRTVPDTPVLATLSGGGLLAVVGADDEVDAALRALLTRVCLDHSPVDVSVAAVLGGGRAHHETWLRWMPHARARVGGEPSVAVGARDGQVLLDRLLAEDSGHGHTVLVVDTASGVHRRSIEAAAAVATERRLHLVVLGESPTTVPAGTRLLLDLAEKQLSVRDRGGRQALATVDVLDLAEAWRAARLVTGRVDEAAVLPADSALPGTVRLPDVMADLSDLDDVEAVIGRWGSSTGLRAQIGVGVDGVVTLDLREDGPHGLVAGTTGSGKSELLQTLLCSLAANTPPSRITFLLVDYKGGAAFRECADLPHTVGYITDLTPALVQRALTSLGAEIAHREELLARYGAKDLVHLEREHPHVAPPSLLICVDEFAALTAEVPEFVEGMVGLAQRGRSLGMHLLLATQRPAGVVTPAIRANTDLRIALRIAGDEDSRDVIDTPDAARISRRTPGRAWVRRTGHGTAELVQGAWVGAREPLRARSAAAVVRPFTAARAPEGPGGDDPERLDPRTDLDRCVRTIRAAHDRLGSPTSRRPWLPPLVDELRLDPAALVAAGHAAGLAPVGRVDDPRRQAQPELVLDYAAGGHVLVHGASGSGKTELLRTVAAAVSLVDAHADGGVAPYVYAVDAAGGGLRVLEALPTVASVVGEQQLGRVLRLLRLLRASVEDRSAALAAAGAADLAALAAAGTPLPRVHVLIDNLPALLEILEGGGAVRRAHVDHLQAVLQNGRRVGIHVTATAPGRGGVPSALAASFGTRLVLRLPTEDDYVMLGVPAQLLDPESAPGAAVWTRRRAQVATVAGVGGTVQPTQLAEVADLLRPAVDGRASGSVPPMPGLVPAHALPAPQGSRVAVGVGAEDVSPVVVDLLDGPVLVAGRSRSGRTAVLAGLAALARRGDPGPAAVAWYGPSAPDGTERLDTPDALTAWLAARGTPRTDGRFDLLLVDDAHRLDRDLENTPRLTALVAAAEEAARHGVALVVSADADDARTRTMSPGLTQLARRSRRGILLQPDGLDGTVLAVTVPSQTVEPVTGPGRGMWCADGTAQLVHAVTAATTATDVRGALP